jgi:CheY-like chemotaxis protein
MPDKPTVLFIDDVEDIFEAARARFQDDYEILRATDPEDAYAIVEERRGQIDVAVVDMWMPSSNGEVNKRAGIEVIERIKGTGGQFGLDPELPLIVLTAHGNIEDLRECLKAGASNYVLKGTTEVFQHLHDRIQAALDAKLGSIARRIYKMRPQETARAGQPAPPAGDTGVLHAIALLEQALSELRRLTEATPAKPANGDAAGW